MRSALARFQFHFGGSLETANIFRSNGGFLFPGRGRRFIASSTSRAQQGNEQLLVVVGGGAAGIYGAIRAKTVAPHLGVMVIEKGKPLSKVKISGGGRCNVTNGHCADKMILAEHYPRGNKEFRGSFFSMHGPWDTISWFSDHGVELKTEDDGRVFPVSDSSSSVIDCLLFELKIIGVLLQTGKSVTNVSTTVGGKYIIKIEKRTSDPIEYVEADYLLIASGSSRQWIFLWSQGYTLATQLGHSIVDPVPSLFTFKIEDAQLAELAGKQKALNSFPPDFGLVKRFWKYILEREHISGDILWASVSNNSIISVVSLLKQCSFGVKGKGQFKDEFVTAGGIPLSEISLNTMESRKQPNLFFAGEVLNVDGVTGGFNFQNAWSGGYIAGTTIGKLALDSSSEMEAV
ncbi:uncharacterized protein YtfP isoform X8 [Macadamia integrifolia]|uniref:uncharacterized protein YtfP isoform X8 n=1 Tax=Macadamia integrifolia TaxID=60698 RepID=UPI001C4F8321|nr:uncharacterized protein YtfP isoform X8 [Macadamia integrifolia]